MARCEDFPCCGHELGCCPAFDDAGRQLDMVCVCGARLPVSRPYSICDGCMEDEGFEDPVSSRWEEDDAEVLESADFESEEEIDEC